MTEKLWYKDTTPERQNVDRCVNAGVFWMNAGIFLMNAEIF